MRPTRTVGTYLFGSGSLGKLEDRIALRTLDSDDVSLYFVDHFFRAKDALLGRLPVRAHDMVQYVDTTDEITTDQVDTIKGVVLGSANGRRVGLLVGIGGGSVLDLTKAVANLLTNAGKAADYQGWDLVKNPAVYKIGVPTLSGTGAEASATCVMMNRAKNLKLGMNSVHTVYDELVLDPDLSMTAPRDQYFYTGMDSYIHCIESLAGSYRHPVADAFSRQALELAREVFLAPNMQSDAARETLMVASYLGGSAIGNSFVGLVHPFSAALSVVLGIHHCLANCIVMNSIEEFYPRETEEFCNMLQKQDISLPKGVCACLSEQSFEQLYNSMIVHEKPLRNALGDRFRDVLTPVKVAEVFRRM